MTLRALILGGFCSVQDLGRPGRAHEGIARSGAWDARSASLANRLVGNSDAAPVLEIVMGHATFVATDDHVVALTGAVAPCSLDGRSVANDGAVAVPAGSRLEIGLATSGVRLYLAVRGGIAAAPVLGSRSWDTLGRIGPPPIIAGDEVPIGDPSLGGAAWFEPVVVPDPSVARDPSSIVEVRVVPGPRTDWLGPGGLDVLLREPWNVSPASDRTGVRLDGPAVPRRSGELVSEAMVPGAIQLPAGGQPIVLGPDCGTTGGYPVVAVVRRRDLDLVGQLRPGRRLRLRMG
jgi:biotin-dependent carboxylase-like uncharacterized protein